MVFLKLFNLIAVVCTGQMWPTKNRRPDHNVILGHCVNVDKMQTVPWIILNSIINAFNAAHPRIRSLSHVASEMRTKEKDKTIRMAETAISLNSEMHFYGKCTLILPYTSRFAIYS